ncbi:MAG: hypothetical protein FJ138_11965 [Deltaproteobacteria bacterium]|nr:hypothetical protein [Deltaproteobacteria bacterium]
MPLLSRRDLLTHLAQLSAVGAGALALPGCYGDSTYDLDRETATQWAERAAALEQGGVYTPAAPGEWAGKEAAHTPTATLMDMGGALTVKAFVNHVMTAEHWISGVYFRDQDNNVFFLQELSYTDGDPGAEKGVTVYAQVPAGVTAVTAFAYCNLHDCWRSETVSRAAAAT